MNVIAIQGYEVVPQAVKVCRELARSNLLTGLVLIGLARSALETGNREAAERATASARVIYDALMRFLSRVENGQQRFQLEGELSPLRQKLDYLSCELTPSS